MNVALLQMDGKIPNLALMRIAAHHRARGDQVTLRRGTRLEPDLFEPFDKVYASLIFERTRPWAERLLGDWPDAVIGGTGWDLSTTLEGIGIDSPDLDYSIYPGEKRSVGFTQRGCRLKCPFCVVPRKEGKMTPAGSIRSIWRGDPWPRDLILLDNDFFGQSEWRERISEIRDGGFRVNFNQGINARFLEPEACEAIASIDYFDVRFERRMIYTAWDNRRDEDRLVRGIRNLLDAGIHPRRIMVYMLIGYWNWEDESDWEHRRSTLRGLGVDPYPMPFVRTPETVGFQRFVCGGYDKRFSWERFKAAKFQPANLDDHYPLIREA